MKRLRSNHPDLLPKHFLCAAMFLLAFAGNLTLQAQTGPFAPTNWPPTIDANASVDYYIVDPNAAFSTPVGWSQTVSFAGGGDQAFQSINLSGLTGDEST